MSTLLAPEELRKQLLAAGATIRRKRGCLVFRRGDDGNGVFLVVKGTISLSMDRDRAGFHSRELGPGAVLGLPATLANSPYSLNAEVIADAELVHLPRRSFLDLLRDHSDLCFEVMSILSDELGESRNALSNIHRARSR